MGHLLFSGPSGFGKTTIAHIISKQGQVNIKAVTGYAITKPSEVISNLTSSIEFKADLISLASFRLPVVNTQLKAFLSR